MSPLWHDGPIDTLPAPGEAPVAWSVRLDAETTDALVARAPLTTRDFRDFAGKPNAPMRLLRRRLVKTLVAAVTDAHPAAVKIGRSALGAPAILSPDGWHVSVSGQWPNCLIAVARSSVGVDVEPLGALPPPPDMLSREEREQLACIPEERYAAEALCRWVAKEAHAKRTGRASRADPAQIVTTPSGVVLLAHSGDGRSTCWLRQSGSVVEAVACP